MNFKIDLLWDYSFDTYGGKRQNKKLEQVSSERVSPETG